MPTINEFYFACFILSSHSLSLYAMLPSLLSSWEVSGERVLGQQLEPGWVVVRGGYYFGHYGGGGRIYSNGGCSVHVRRQSRWSSIIAVDDKAQVAVTGKRATPDILSPPTNGTN